MAKFNKSDIVIGKTGVIYKVLDYYDSKHFIGEHLIEPIIEVHLDSRYSLFIPGKDFEKNKELFLPILKKITFTTEVKKLALTNLFRVENKENFIFTDFGKESDRTGISILSELKPGDYIFKEPESNLSLSLKDFKKIEREPEKKYTKSQLVEFGNYLLSDDRAVRVTEKVKLRTVSEDDIKAVFNKEITCEVINNTLDSIKSFIFESGRSFYRDLLKIEVPELFFNDLVNLMPLRPGGIFSSGELYGLRILPNNSLKNEIKIFYNKTLLTNLEIKINNE